MSQDAREEAAPLFGARGPLSTAACTVSHNTSCMMQNESKKPPCLQLQPTGADSCRIQGKKQLLCLGKDTTQRTCKHCCSQSQHQQDDAGCKGESSSIVWAWGPLSTGAGTVGEGQMRPTDASLLPGHSLPALPAAGPYPAAAGFSVCPQCACTGSSCWAWCCLWQPWDF